MNIRKIKRRMSERIRANHEETFDTFSVAIGEYAGTWRVWHTTNPETKA